MEIIISSRETVALSKMVRAIAAATPRSNDRLKALNTLDEIVYLISEFTQIPQEQRIDNEDLLQDLLNRLNEKHYHDDAVVGYGFAPSPCKTEVEISVVFDSEIMGKLAEAVTDEVEGLSGAFITMYGVIRMFGSSLKRLNERVNKIVNTARENYNT